ncbi:MAG: DUF6067 family protein [Planctomycetota bacterium]|nr:DUF6067 family protein [Planctomycetota bacterium]
MLLNRSLLLASLMFAWSAIAGEEVPSQFQAWGSRGPGLAPVPAGWTEVRAEPRVRSAPDPTQDEVANGFMVFERRPFEPIYLDTVPATFERDVRLQAFAAQGQYEPLSFAVYALTPLKNVQVTAGGLKTKQGGSIPASHLDVRLVMPVRSAVSYENANDKRFTLAPFYLEKHDHFDIAQGKTAQLWLTVNVPATAKAGDYEGAVSIQPAGKRAYDVPVTIKVLPFRLPPTPVETGVSYFPSENLGIREKEMIDQRDHGINANESAVGAQVVSRDKHFGDDDAEATRKSIKTAIALRKKVYGDAANRFPITVEVGHQILYFWDQKKGWFDFWPRSPELEADFFNAIKVCEETIKAEGGPPMRVFIMDEPGGHPDQLKETAYYHKLLKDKLPQMQTYVTLGGGVALGIDELGLLGPTTDLVTINRFDMDICKLLVARKKVYGVYNGGGATEAVTGYTRDRYFFGFYCWKTGAGEILQWVYRFGDAWRDPIRGNHGYVMLAPDGPLPSIPWEGTRAGVDDHRYMDLLWRLITAAKADPNAAKAVAAGREAALEVLSTVDFSYQPRTGNGTPPPVCATLDKWRWKVAVACMDLLTFVPLDKALATVSERPGPLELPMPKNEGGTVRYGPELLPETGFENGTGPWKMSGKPVSKGGVDNTVAHSGKSSFMLENSREATGMDVVVCVWGWGGPGPSMTLSAGKTYEFSAFVKTDSVKPQIRFTVPAGAAVRDNEGEDPPDASGWRRLWRRVTVNKEVKPGYLAIWLQGPGKVWADDLSCRETILPPFVVEPVQTLIDGSDRSVSVRIAQFGSTEISVRVQPPGKSQPQVVKIPPQGEAVAEFDPKGLPVGAHELKVDSLSSGGAPYSVTVAFRRVAGPFDR